MTPFRQPPANAARTARADGEATRVNILEAAGQLFAQHGYAHTTSKAICERAQTNMAAVNYYFGSRDGLYLEVLNLVQERLMSMAFLHRLVDSPIPASEKLGRFMHALVDSTLDPGRWHTRVWAREILSPSPLRSVVMRDQTLPKFDILSRIVGDIAGVPPDDEDIASYVFTIIAPCLMLLVVDRRADLPIQAMFKRPAAELAAHLTRFAVAGLEAVGAQRAAILSSVPASSGEISPGLP